MSDNRIWEKIHSISFYKTNCTIRIFHSEDEVDLRRAELLETEAKELRTETNHNNLKQPQGK